MRGHSDAWPTSLRALRANRPPLAKRGARGELFSAGLEQAEQFWMAANSVGPETRPLLLFYGLGQAGQALCAAAATKPSAGHGLTFKMVDPLYGEQADLGEVMIAPNGAGLATEVASIRASPLLQEPVSLGRLIGALGYFASTVVPSAGDTNRLEVMGGESGAQRNPHTSPATGELTLSPVPAHLTTRDGQVDVGYPGVGRRTGAAPGVEEIREWLRPYPALAKLGTPRHVSEPWSYPYGSSSITVTWDVSGDGKAGTQAQWVRSILDVVSAEHGPSGSPYGEVLPGVGGNDSAQDPLVTWWLVLYGLSNLVRYHPAAWRATLDVDKSTLAVPLEQLVSFASEKVPDLLFEAFVDLGGGRQ